MRPRVIWHEKKSGQVPRRYWPVCSSSTPYSHASGTLPTHRQYNPRVSARLRSHRFYSCPLFVFLTTPVDKKANTLWQPIVHLSDISCPCDTHSVGSNNITGDAADHLAMVVLEHAAMTDFCGIPLASLRENSITGLNLEGKGVGVPGAIVLSKLLSSAAALTSLEYACAARTRSLFCQRPLTPLSSHLRSRARSLRQNQLGPQGGAALAEGLKGNSTLRSLE